MIYCDRHSSRCSYFDLYHEYAGEAQRRWDEYQTELIRKFYGNEPSAKKSLNVIRIPPDSIVVPGFHGEFFLTVAYVSDLNIHGHLRRCTWSFS